MPKKIRMDEDEDFEETSNMSREDINDEIRSIRTELDKRTPKVPERRPQPTQEVERKRRFVPFHQPERTGVIDAETRELVLESNLEFYADVLERLERIELQIGALLRG